MIFIVVIGVRLCKDRGSEGLEIMEQKIKRTENILGGPGARGLLFDGSTECPLMNIFHI